MKTTSTILAIYLSLIGCKSYYQETGVSLTTGDVEAPIEVSDSSDIVTVRMLFSMTGARVWASRGYSVAMKYKSSETNEYFGIVTTHQNIDSDITASYSKTNDIPSNDIGKE